MHHHRIPGPQLLRQAANSATHTFVLVSCSASVSLFESATSAGWSKPDNFGIQTGKSNLHCIPLMRKSCVSTPVPIQKVCCRVHKAEWRCQTVLLHCSTSQQQSDDKPVLVTDCSQRCCLSVILVPVSYWCASEAESLTEAPDKMRYRLHYLLAIHP